MLPLQDVVQTRSAQPHQPNRPVARFDTTRRWLRSSGADRRGSGNGVRVTVGALRGDEQANEAAWSLLLVLRPHQAERDVPPP